MKLRNAHLSPQYIAGAVGKLDLVFGEALSGLPTLCSCLSEYLLGG
jgi:hypothetical protein